MKITAISVQVRDKDRVNISVDGKYRFSLDIMQVGELGVKLGNDYTESELQELETESQFGKTYTRALEHALTRPRSTKEMKDYLYRKTRPRRLKDGAVKDGISENIAARVLERLQAKGYVDDETFARFWVENRNTQKGISRRKLEAELRAKGVDASVIHKVLATSPRDETAEIQKIIAKKRTRYDDEQKFMQYLLRQGFDYDLIKQALSEG